MEANEIEIYVDTRKEFGEHVKKIFIPSCNRLFGKDDKFFNFGEAINKWTCFGAWDENGVFLSIYLKD